MKGEKQNRFRNLQIGTNKTEVKNMNEKIILQVVGYKNSGKTTTTCKLIEQFVQLGWKVGSIKHDAHSFEIDHPGKDTWLHRESGASVVAITSQHKTAIMEQRSTPLDELIERIQGVDIVIIEGYKFENYPKIVLLRNEGDIPLVQETSQILAISSWFPYEHPSIPVVDKDNFSDLFRIIKKYVQEKMGE